MPNAGRRSDAGKPHTVAPYVNTAMSDSASQKLGAAGIARYARSTVADLAGADWVRTARAKGLRAGVVYGRHVLANALPPLVVLLALSLPGVVAGSVFVESVFAWPGMGRVMVGAIASRDYPVVMGATVLYAALVILANLAADLALPLIDPRRDS